MTHKDAILKVLEEKGVFTPLEVLEMINEKNYIDWIDTKKPISTISARLGEFITQNDSRVKRVNGAGNGKKVYVYYLAKYEDQLNLSEIVENEAAPEQPTSKKYKERDLHKLLSSYLKNQNIYSKTILHERSSNGKDDHQKWIHPDMIGFEFLKLKNPASNNLRNLINKADTFKLMSFELKREIKSDHELKKCFFQAVSNSSWANYGYLVAFEISRNLMKEMERLNRSFGIGIIELSANPFESKELFQPSYKELDFMTIDKLCEVNEDFKESITLTEIMMSAEDKYLKGTKERLKSFCDKYLTTDSEIEEYCIDKNIPFDKEDEFVS